MNKIAVLTSGGDAPGMNAAVRAVVRVAKNYGLHVYGVERGWEGLIKGNIQELGTRSVSDMIHRGGTFLKTARCPEFITIEGQKKVADTLEAYGIKGVIAIGGDGTFRGARDLSNNFGIKCMGIPATIDNDLAYTDYTIGFDTAVNTVISAINSLRDTMQSHDRVSLVEVMGRHCGDIALYASIAGGAEYVLIPEKPYDLDEIAKSLIKSKLRGKTSNMIILAEGAGSRDEIIAYLNEKAGVDIKKTHLGHVQRGGSPSMADRILATRFAIRAVEEIMKPNAVSCAIGIKDNKIKTFNFDKALSCKKEVNEELYNALKILSI